VIAGMADARAPMGEPALEVARCTSCHADPRQTPPQARMSARRGA